MALGEQIPTDRKLFAADTQQTSVVVSHELSPSEGKIFIYIFDNICVNIYCKNIYL